MELSPAALLRLSCYTLDNYADDVHLDGLAATWETICKYLLQYGESDGLLNSKYFGELYEFGLAIEDKYAKKSSGQYYTPEDVARVMSQWLDEAPGDVICDVACGTGNLILAYLDYIGYDKAMALIEAGKLYLYDIDETALKICKTVFEVKYGQVASQRCHFILADFLDKDVTLPPHGKTISNPPYTAISAMEECWEKTSVLMQTKETYAAFMEKIVTQSQSAVIITPFSFISGKKFGALRDVLSRYTGKIFSFDNVPGAIFSGKKYGVFNSNTSNSVRAAITVVDTRDDSGFQLTPLIRFKSVEREALLCCDVLEGFLPSHKQKIPENTAVFYKCFPELQPLYDRMEQASDGHTLEELVCENGTLELSVPSTCRYYTVAFAGTLNRNGQLSLRFDDRKKFNYAFCLINSSFAYWHWRLFDGGITYPKSLLMKVPSVYHLLTEDDHRFFAKTAEKMIACAGDYVITKNNVGVQENIKYPRQYRDAINQRILSVLEMNMDNETLDKIHSNKALEVSV